MNKTFYINCGSDYHTKEALNGFRNKMVQCDELLDFKRGQKMVRLKTKDTFIFLSEDDLHNYESEPMFDRGTFKLLYQEHRKSESRKFINEVEEILATDWYKLELPNLYIYIFAVKDNSTKSEVTRLPVVSTSQKSARTRFKKKYREQYPMEEYHYRFREVFGIPKRLSGSRDKDAIEQELLQQIEQGADIYALIN